MAATAMVAVSRLGGEAELWAIVDSDWVGEQIIQGLQAERVDTTQVLRVAGDGSQFVVVCVDQKSGERNFIPAGDWRRPDNGIGDLARLAGAGCLLIDHVLQSSELRAAKEAQRLGVPVVCDTERLSEWHENVYPFVDYAIISERGARELSDDLHEACRTICDMGAGCAVVTLGHNGLVYLNGDGYGQLSAFEADVVDTTGAGDVFHGAFCYGLVEGFPLQENLRFSSAVSALKCGKIGGRAGIPSRAQVDAFLRDNGALLE